MNRSVQIRKKAVEEQPRYTGVLVAARPWKRVTLVIVACCFLMNARPLRGEPNDDTSYPVKLGFLYQLTLYVQWPSGSFKSATAPLVVCVIGHDPFDSDLEEEFENHTVEKHPVVIRRAKGIDNLGSCHVVFVPAPESKQSAKVIASLQGSPVLTVGETPGFAERGGLINFTVLQNRLHFEINLDAVRQTSLTISSRVLALAKIVRDPSQP